MVEILYWDEQLFRLINGAWSNPWLDAIMPWWRERVTWIPLYAGLAIWAGWKWKWRALIWAVCLVAAVGLADTISHRVIKKNVQRPRPCRTEGLQEDVRLLVPCGGGYSFTSNHAANHFALAGFVSRFVRRRWRWPWFLWAASIAFGQVYVGLHYPLDILGGALLGLGIGWLFAYLLKNYRGKKNNSVEIW